MDTPEIKKTPEVEIFPSLMTRYQSTFIDFLFVFTMMFIIAAIIDKITATPDWFRAVIFIFLFFLYEPTCQSLGTTFGNNFMGIKVRRFNNPEQKINFLQGVFRFAIKISLGWISFFSITGNRERRALHDIFPGTIVLKDK